MNVRWLPALIGLAIAFVLLAFVTKVSMFGVTCYAIGEVNLFGQMRCLNPPVYWGAWIVAIILFLLALRPATSAPQHDTTHAAEPNPSRPPQFNVGALAFVAVIVIAGAAYWYYRTKVAPTEQRGAEPSGTAEMTMAPQPSAPPTPDPGPEPPPPAIGPDGLPITAPPNIGPDGMPVNAPAPPSPPQAPSAKPLPVPGQLRWSGVATESNGRVSGVTVMFAPSGDADIAWTDVGCGGSLVFTEKSGNSHRYAETITYGLDKCVAQATVTLTPIDNGAALSLFEEAVSSTNTATLKPF